MLAHLMQLCHAVNSPVDTNPHTYTLVRVCARAGAAGLSNLLAAIAHWLGLLRRLVLTRLLYSKALVHKSSCTRASLVSVRRRLCALLQLLYALTVENISATLWNACIIHRSQDVCMYIYREREREREEGGGRG
jgi:hypothetical protein